MVTRPRIQIVLSKQDKLLEVVCFIMLLCLWIAVLFGYSSLNKEIPIHFNADGKADGYGNKVNIFFLPIVASIIYIGMTLLNRHPHVFNYPSEINRDNAEQMYRSATKLLRVLKFVVVLIFSSIVAITFRSASARETDLGYWFLISCILLTILPTIYYLIKSKTKHRSKGN